MIDKLENLEEKYEELNKLMTDPAVLNILKNCRNMLSSSRN